MFLVGITLFLILIGLGFFVYGAIALSKYAFRLGTGQGLMTLLFPPYTIYFALFKLEEEDKAWPTASWLFGIVVTALLCITFYPDLSALARGDMERFQQPEEEAQAEVVEEETEEAEEASDSATAEDDEADEAAEGEEEAAANSEEAAGEEAAGEEAAGEEAGGEAAEGEESAEAEAGN